MKGKRNFKEFFCFSWVGEFLQDLLQTFDGENRELMFIEAFSGWNVKENNFDTGSKDF